MSWEIGTATNYLDLLDKLNAFLLKGHSLTPSYTGVGTGRIDNIIGTAASVQETVTVTFSGPTAFSVSGSVTGSMGSGTVGEQFSHTRCAFMITAGTTAWQNGDTISFVMTLPWVQMRGVAGSEYIWKAPGNAGQNQIFVGARSFSNPIGYYNWQLGGFTAYTPGLDFGMQPGSFSKSPTRRDVVLPLWNASIPYWFVANGRRVVVIAKVSTIYESAYLGFIEQYPSPGQWSYPLAVGGSLAFDNEPAAGSISWAYSNAGKVHSGFPRADKNNEGNANTTQFRIRRSDGLWRHLASNVYDTTMGGIWPYTDSMTDLRANLDGSYPMFPIVLSEPSPNVFGQIDGVWATTGHGNAAENVISVGRDSWLVVQNTFRTSKTDYFAVRMD